MEKVGKEMLTRIGKPNSNESNRLTSTQTSQTDSLMRTRKERVEEAALLLRRQQAEFNLPQYPDKTERIMAIGYERHFTNARITPDKYEAVYDLAIQIYRQTDAGKGPFSLTHILLAINQFVNNAQREAQAPRRVVTNQKLLPPAPKCELCKGTTLAYDRDEETGRSRIIYETVGDRKRAKRCPRCTEVSDGEQTTHKT